MSLYNKLYHYLNVPIRILSFLSSFPLVTDLDPLGSSDLHPILCSVTIHLVCVPSQPPVLNSQWSRRLFLPLLLLLQLLFSFLLPPLPPPLLALLFVFLPFFPFSSSFITCSFLVSWYLFGLCISGLSLPIRFLLSAFHSSVEKSLFFSSHSLLLFHFFSWWLLWSGW